MSMCSHSAHIDHSPLQHWIRLLSHLFPSLCLAQWRMMPHLLAVETRFPPPAITCPMICVKTGVSRTYLLCMLALTSLPVEFHILVILHSSWKRFPLQEAHTREYLTHVHSHVHVICFDPSVACAESCFLAEATPSDSVSSSNVQILSSCSNDVSTVHSPHFHWNSPSSLQSFIDHVVYLYVRGALIYAGEAPRFVASVTKLITPFIDCFRHLPQGKSATSFLVPRRAGLETRSGRKTGFEGL